MRIYVASRASVLERGAMWRQLRSEGFPIISTWIDEDGPGQTKDYSELWSRIDSEIAECDRLILYVEPSDFPIKGALVEVGIALARGKEVYVLCYSQGDLQVDFRKLLGSWINHPLAVSHVCHVPIRRDSILRRWLC